MSARGMGKLTREQPKALRDLSSIQPPNYLERTEEHQKAFCQQWRNEKEETSLGIKTQLHTGEDVQDDMPPDPKVTIRADRL